MKYKCQICETEECQIILKSENENLARYGLLSAIEYSPISTGLNQVIAYCEACNFAWNTAFQYDKVKYDNDKIIEAGYFSKRYIDYQKKSALHLRRIIGFKPNVIVEIGAGAGIFINEFDAEKKIAIEPSEEANQIDASIEVYNEYYTEERFNFAADIVVLRQVLEHIKDPIIFLNNIQKSFNKSDEFYLYIEIPNSMLTFKFGRFYDYYYEHCNYFSINTIAFLAEKINLNIVDLSTDMDGELISILFTNRKNSISELKLKISNNKNKIIEKLNYYKLNKKLILAWGASGNGVQILTSLKITMDTIPLVIDSDKNKQGKFIPGTCQKIISPEDAIEIKPDVVLVLTQFHKKEIGDSCRKLFPKSEVWYID